MDSGTGDKTCLTVFACPLISLHKIAVFRCFFCQVLRAKNFLSSKLVSDFAILGSEYHVMETGGFAGQALGKYEIRVKQDKSFYKDKNKLN